MQKYCSDACLDYNENEGRKKGVEQKLVICNENPGMMDILPDSLVQDILCLVKNAKDMACCLSVCKKWNESMRYVRKLQFARSVGNKFVSSDTAVTRLVLKTVALEALTVFCPFSSESLLEWLSHTKSSLRHLELRLDDNGKRSAENSLKKLECVTPSIQLKTLRLWSLILSNTPSNWKVFSNLHLLQLVGVRLRDNAFAGVLSSCPVLKELTLLSCDCLGFLNIEHGTLERCRLDFSSETSCSVLMVMPKVHSLEIHGASYVCLRGDHNLHHLIVASNSGKVSKVEVGKLPDLETLTLRGRHWSWESIHKMLHEATEIQQLDMRVEFCGDKDMYEPFPEIDFVDFFSAHPKLRVLDAHGAMFAALSHKNSLKKLISTIEIPCLEMVSITIRSPLNASQKFASLEALVRCSPMLHKLVLKASQMKSCDPEADNFFIRLQQMKLKYHVIQIE